MSTPNAASSSRKKSGKAKATPAEVVDTSSSKRTRKSSRKSETTSKPTPTLQKEDKAVEDAKSTEATQANHDDDDEGEGDGEDDDVDEHDFDGWLGGHGGGPGGSGFSSTLRALSGMMSGMSGRFRGMLESLKQKEDPTMQLIGLQNLSEMLLVSTEDTLAGHFSPDLYIKELGPLLHPDDFTGEENPEMMLLACRCIANMMEALPASTAAVVYGGAVPVLLSKLVEIQYMDLAEQALLV
jgi:E3 ubiquitin-protein ligase TRIP12